MSKDIYKSAIYKIKADEDFQSRLEASMKLRSKREKIRRYKYVPAMLLACFILFTGVTQITSWIDKQKQHENRNTNSQSSPYSPSEGGLENVQNDFEFTEEGEVETSYIAVVYMDGFAYEPSEWLRYSFQLSDNTDYEAIKGEKLGEVTLDLKGKRYRGTPPDFSSTLDIGSEIYIIKDTSPTSAIMVNFQGHYEIYYRSRKHVSSSYEPLDLNLSEVFDMLSVNPEIVSIELRNEENGSWMNTSGSQELITLVNRELPSLPLSNYGELESNPYESSYRIPVNLIFADGRVLHMQILPENGVASTFGGFITISKELSSAFEKLYKQGSAYPRLSDFVPYHETQVSYLYLKNHKNGEEVVCEEPAWSRSSLFSILSYYRADETEAGDSQMVMTVSLGRSESDNMTINFFETADKIILTEIQGRYYKPVRGQLLFDSLYNFLYNHTELGM
jgi:hypothetical protein